MSSENLSAAGAMLADGPSPDRRPADPVTGDVKPLCISVAESMAVYFKTLNGHAPKSLNLYETVLEQVEPPLLRATLDYCDGNQSRAAELLGMNRATLRKKLMQYRITTR